jgi:hypothetical protein
MADAYHAPHPRYSSPGEIILLKQKELVEDVESDAGSGTSTLSAYSVLFTIYEADAHHTPHPSFFYSIEPGRLGEFSSQQIKIKRKKGVSRHTCSRMRGVEPRLSALGNQHPARH